MKDPYIQENGTLKNKLGITEYKELNDAEKDIGGTCLFLASEAASYISGETITLQGGSGLRP